MQNGAFFILFQHRPEGRRFAELEDAGIYFCTIPKVSWTTEQDLFSKNTCFRVPFCYRSCRRLSRSHRADLRRVAEALGLADRASVEDAARTIEN